MQSKLTKTIDPRFLPCVDRIRETVKKYNLKTVCAAASCPNQYECYSNSSVTFMILGDVCTRTCAFCGVKKGKAPAPDYGEPERIAEAVSEMGLEYAVITSVTRDDLDDCGAQQFVRTVEEIRKKKKTVKTELLIPDFNGRQELIEKVAGTSAEIIGHNMETVECLYRKHKPESSYYRSIYVISEIKKISPKTLTKSAVMVGLGEEKREVFRVLNDLKSVQCDMVVVGQYLRPASCRMQVARTAGEEEFKEYEDYGRKIGIGVMAGHFARSSYRAEEFYNEYSRRNNLNE